MRHWGMLVTAFYAMAVILLFPVGSQWLAGISPMRFDSLVFFWPDLIVVLVMVGAQALLLFLSVDSSFRRLRPRQHVMVSAGLVGFLAACLMFGAIAALSVTPGITDYLDFSLERVPENLLIPAGIAVAIFVWAFWGLLFYVFYKGHSDVINSVVGWLIRGSVLELLIAMPCHIIVRHRNECTAPFVSAYGVVTGIAIMLLAFGPSILFLYRRKFREYEQRRKDHPQVTRH